MNNDIRNAVTRRLDDLFPEKPIYINCVKQGLQEPCFFVQALETPIKRIIGVRYFRQNPFCIQYHPSAVQAAEEMGQVIETLMFGMQYISLKNGDHLKGSNIRAVEEDGILNFFVNYDLFVYEQKESKEAMEKIEIQKGLVK